MTAIRSAAIVEPPYDTGSANFAAQAGPGHRWSRDEHDLETLPPSPRSIISLMLNRTADLDALGARIVLRLGGHRDGISPKITAQKAAGI